MNFFTFSDDEKGRSPKRSGSAGKNAVHPSIFGSDTGIITSQPNKEEPIRQAHQECPEGLEDLKTTQHLFIKQSGQAIEMFKTVETHYEVLNSDGERIFMAEETTDTSTKLFCRGTKCFDVSVFIRSGLYRKEVIRMDGEPRSCGCGGDIKLRLTRCTLGTIEQETDCYFPRYSVRDCDSQEILKITGPESTSCFSYKFNGIAEFDVWLPDEITHVGKIAKYWNGKNNELLLKSEIWGCRFPLDMKVSHKALLLAACFLLSFQFHDY